MQIKRFITVLSLIVLTTANLFSQQTWTLNQCISYAIDNNINLTEYEIFEKLSIEDAKQAKRNLLPGVNASTNAGLNFGRSVDPNTNDYINTEFLMGSDYKTILNIRILENKYQS